MLGEEYQMIAGSSQNLATPAAPTVTQRSPAPTRPPSPAARTNFTVLGHGAELLRGDRRRHGHRGTPLTAGQVVDV